MRTGIVRFHIRTDEVGRRTPKNVDGGGEIVIDHTWRGFDFIARPPKGWQAAVLNARAARLSSSDLTIAVGNAPGVGGMFTGTVRIRMSGSRVDSAIRRIDHYYNSGPTISQVLVIGAVSALLQQPATPAAICRPFLGMATQIVAA